MHDLHSLIVPSFACGSHSNQKEIVIFRIFTHVGMSWVSGVLTMNFVRKYRKDCSQICCTNSCRPPDFRKYSWFSLLFKLVLTLYGLVLIIVAITPVMIVEHYDGENYAACNHPHDKVEVRSHLKCNKYQIWKYEIWKVEQEIWHPMTMKLN